MGTTTTAAYVDDDEVVIAHVGDSRAYLLRDGELIRLTKDHSLVGELVARGKLTEEQAEQHPQRSVITRALGPEASVQVDVDIFPAKPGDLFLLCSDGLTSMVHEPKLRPLFEDGDSLETLGKRLIDAANAAGGRDNITVILFRLEAVEPREGEAAAAAGDPGRGHHRVRDVRGRRRAARRARASRARRGSATTRCCARPRSPTPSRTTTARSGTVAMSAIRPAASPPTRRPRSRRLRNPRPDPHRRRVHRAAPHPSPPTRGSQPPASAAGASPSASSSSLAIVALILVGGWMATRAVYFVGTDPRDDRTIAIFRGLPYDLPLGIELYQRYAGSGVTIDDVPPARRTTFTDHKLRSKDDAENLVIALERGQIE